MTTNVYIGNDFVLRLGSTASPPVFADMCSAQAVSNLSKLAPKVKTTGLCDEQEQYRPGLPDGAQVTIKAKFDPADTQTQGLIAACDAGETREFHLALKTTPTTVYTDFSGTMLGYALDPVVGDLYTITYTLQITDGPTFHHP